MKELTESQAVSILSKNGVEIRNKMIIAKSGLKGLSACSALDYLINYCGYKASLG